MKFWNFQISLCLLLTLLPTIVSAQAPDKSRHYHPFLSNKFHIGIGQLWSQREFEARVDGTVRNTDIDFDEGLGFDESEATPFVELVWRYSENWSLLAQHTTLSSRGGNVLEEDVEWGDTVFKSGTFVRAGSDTSFARLLVARSFLKSSPEQELRLGVGLHWMEIDSFVEGQVTTDTSDEFQHEKANVEFPLPNLGAWYMYSWSPKWVATVGIDWLSVSFDNYSGNLLNSQAGIHYQISDTFGVGLNYHRFKLDVDVDESDLHGRIESILKGPVLALTASW